MEDIELEQLLDEHRVMKHFIKLVADGVYPRENYTLQQTYAQILYNSLKITEEEMAEPKLEIERKVDRLALAIETLAAKLDDEDQAEIMAILEGGSTGSDTDNDSE